MLTARSTRSGLAPELMEDFRRTFPGLRLDTIHNGTGNAQGNIGEPFQPVYALQNSVLNQTRSVEGHDMDITPRATLHHSTDQHSFGLESTLFEHQPQNFSSLSSMSFLTPGSGSHVNPYSTGSHYGSYMPQQAQHQYSAQHGADPGPMFAIRSPQSVLPSAGYHHSQPTPQPQFQHQYPSMDRPQQESIFTHPQMLMKRSPEETAMSSPEADHSGGSGCMSPSAFQHIPAPVEEVSQLRSLPGVFPTEAFGDGGIHMGRRESFRFETVLRASTSMTKHPDEIPVTYLNKGHIYTFSIRDSTPVSGRILTYRSYARISFDEPAQRKRAAYAWRVWRDGRGGDNDKEAEKMKAVICEGLSPRHGKGGRSIGFELEEDSVSFDGFAFRWTTSRPEQQIDVDVKFNFLSTDFSHSKGVKGCTVRFCVKTEVLADHAMPIPPGMPTCEVVFCKVKLFRDKGAERKLVNDTRHIEKVIAKLREKVRPVSAAVEKGKKKGHGRSHSFSVATGEDDTAHKAGRKRGHKRDWSRCTQASMFEDEVKMEGDSEEAVAKRLDKAMELEAMFSSQKPSSLLYLRGDPEDDPDMFPVRVDKHAGEMDVDRVGEPMRPRDVPRNLSFASITTSGTSAVSPALSHHSLGSRGSVPEITVKSESPLKRQASIAEAALWNDPLSSQFGIVQATVVPSSRAEVPLLPSTGPSPAPFSPTAARFAEQIQQLDIGGDGMKQVPNEKVIDEIVRLVRVLKDRGFDYSHFLRQLQEIDGTGSGTAETISAGGLTSPPDS
ncbi:hypothetical protein YB2330_000242 [Saitoella coloradoensis]